MDIKPHPPYSPELSHSDNYLFRPPPKKKKKFCQWEELQFSGTTFRPAHQLERFQVLQGWNRQDVVTILKDCGTNWQLRA